jgi:tetrapyrrole methylase family protein/MazG family protein
MPSENGRGIVLLGLGPGGADMITRQAWEHLSSLPEVFLRTRMHPAVAGFPDGVTVHSFDDLYEAGETFEDVYARIVEQVLDLGRRPQGVTYAVPGHPLVAETTGPEIVRQAQLAGIPVRVIEGISFLEPTCTALGIDPFPTLILVDAFDLARLHTPNFSPDVPALIAQIYSRQIASEVKLTLNAVYPDEHRVRLVHAAGTPQEVVEDLALYEIDRSEYTGLLTALYVPPLDTATSLESFQEVLAHLRAPDGCPWDREQTMQTLGPSLLEETYEALEALDNDDMDGLREELGDVLLLVTFLAQIGNEEGLFTMGEVIQGIHQKLVRRHPHVFGETDVDGTGEVLRNWEKLKAEEREKNGKDRDHGILDGVSKILPALTRAQEFQDRAAHVGFDWPDIEGVKEKLLEEWREVAAAKTPEELEKELGDLLFSAVNLTRWYKFDAETALRKANQRFYRRFRHIEKNAHKGGKELSDLSLDEMEALWQDAKRTGDDQ